MNMTTFANIGRLGIKELWSLARDPMLLALIAYTFTISIYIAATVNANKLPLTGTSNSVMASKVSNPKLIIPNTM